MQELLWVLEKNCYFWPIFWMLFSFAEIFSSRNSPKCWKVCCMKPDTWAFYWNHLATPWPFDICFVFNIFQIDRFTHKRDFAFLDFVQWKKSICRKVHHSFWMHFILCMYAILFNASHVRELISTIMKTK